MVTRYAVPAKAHTAAAVAAKETVLVKALLFASSAKAAKTREPMVTASAKSVIDLSAGVIHLSELPTSPKALGAAAPPTNIPTTKPTAEPSSNKLRT